MRICVFGAGAVGGNFAARLAASGHDVSIVARGPHLAAIREKGITLKSGDKVIAGKVRASDRPADLGKQDIVLSTLKANSLPALAEGVTPLLDRDTMVVFAQNGIPWWYAHGLQPSRPKPPELPRLDPGGALARTVGAERAIGGVIYSGNEVTEPGVIFHTSPNMNELQIGAPDDRPSNQIDSFRAALEESGIKSKPFDDIRRLIWAKALQILVSAPFCTLTEQGTAVTRTDPLVKDLVTRATTEGRAIAAAHGITLGEDMGGNRIQPSAGGNHKPSMFQDYERGRPMEIDALVMAPLAFARSAGVPTPTLDVVAGLLTRRAANKGLYTP
jgi:2-dehydropantoate 2-reductase